MLSKKNRLPIQKFIGKKNKIFKTDHFLVKVFTEPTKISRFGVVIANKFARTIAARNRIRRLIFSIIEKWYPALPLNDYLIIVTKFLEPERRLLELELEKIFNQIKP